MVNLITQVIVSFLEHFGIRVVILTQHAHHYEFEVILPQLDEFRLVFDLFVEAPKLVHEEGCIKGEPVLLLRAEGEEPVILLVIDDLVLDVSVAQLEDRLLRATNLCEKL